MLPFSHILNKYHSNFNRLYFAPILYYTLGSLGLLLATWRRADIHHDSNLYQGHPNERFDFIIVGAGSAGCVVANRLSRHYKVLLLEAGGEPNPLQAIPGFAIFMLNYPETDWMHRSVPQKYSTFNSINQQSSWSTGIGLGGTGNINLMLYLRGNQADFNNWANITGDSSWSYEGVLPHFKNLETYRDRSANPHYHGFKGDLNVEIPNYIGIANEFVQAGNELGYPSIDVNDPHTEGFFTLFFSTKKGVRHAPYRAFLQPVRRRKSLTIRKYSHVNRILFNGNNEVYGVEYDRHGRRTVAIATKEVIISAGAVTTPKVLMLSGIGPKEHLEQLGIPVRHNLPVGKNLQDHTGVGLSPIFINKPRTLFLDRDVGPKEFAKWLATGKGKLSSSGAHASAVLSSSYAKARGEGDWPDIGLFLFGLAVHKTFDQLFSKAFNLKLDEMTRYYKHAIGKDSFIIHVTGARPYSRGYIQLSGTNPYDKLIIEPNYLGDPDGIDLKVLLEGTKFALHLVENTTAFQNLGARFTTEPLPGCEHLPFRSDEYWVCYARRYTITIHHPCGTASMGKIGSPFAVVDSELRVQGIRNLRVIDASVMPVVPVTNTQAPTMMIAEKGAHMILKHWRHRRFFGYGHYGKPTRFDI